MFKATSVVKGTILSKFVRPNDSYGKSFDYLVASGKRISSSFLVTTFTLNRTCSSFGLSMVKTAEIWTDVGRSVAVSGNGHGLDYDRERRHAPVRGVRMGA
jgi:hypothetical protein